MTLDELLDLLTDIKDTHSDAGNAAVFAKNISKDIKFQINNVGFSRRLKRPRILLED